MMFNTFKHLLKEFLNYRIVDTDYSYTFKLCNIIYVNGHKEDLERNPSIRLINPSKSDIGKFSKIILDRIIPIIRARSPLYPWINTKGVLDCFRDIKSISFGLVIFITWSIHVESPPS